MASFAADATAKFWGCNAGVTGWVYGADDDTHYWEALNTRNTPKPSIAQAFADYLGLKVFGAGSGSDIEVELNGKWITSEKYKQLKKHWPSGRIPQRLHPTRGDYNAFSPAPGASP